MKNSIPPIGITPEIQDIFKPSEIVDFLMSMHRALLESEDYQDWLKDRQDEYHFFFMQLQQSLFTFAYKDNATA